MFFMSNNNTNKIEHTGTYNTQQMPPSVQNWRIMDYETKILNTIPYILSTSDKIFNITLKCEPFLFKYWKFPLIIILIIHIWFRQY